MIFKLFLTRDKQMTEQYLNLFAHASFFLLCMYFALGYSMVMSEEMINVMALFPSLMQLSTGTNNSDATEEMMQYILDKAEDSNMNDNTGNHKKGRSRSEVCKFMLNKISTLADHVAAAEAAEAEAEASGDTNYVHAPTYHSKHTYVTNFIHFISSHGAKRHTTNTLVNNPQITPMQAINRIGWSLKNFLSIMVYIDKLEYSNWQCVRVTAGWQLPAHPGASHSGHSPTLESLGAQDASIASRVAKSLFAKYIHTVDRIKDILFATVLLRLQDFIYVLLDHPEKLFGEINEVDDDGAPTIARQHKFLTRICMHLQLVDASLTLSTLLKWGEVIQKQFISDNFAFVNLSDLFNLSGPEPLMVDTRNLTSHLTEINDHVQHSHYAISNSLVDVKQGVTDVERVVVLQAKRQKFIIDQVGSLARNQHWIMQTQICMMHNQRWLMQVVSQAMQQPLPQDFLQQMIEPPEQLLAGETNNEAENCEEEEAEVNIFIAHIAGPRAAAPMVAFIHHIVPIYSAGLKVINCFVSWFVDGSYQAIGLLDPRTNLSKKDKSTLKQTLYCLWYTIDRLYLWLPRHIEPPPVSAAGVTTEAIIAWRDNVVNMAKAAWSVANLQLGLSSDLITAFKTKTAASTVSYRFWQNFWITLDYQLQKCLPLCPSYLRDGRELMTLLDNLGPLPTDARFFTVDAVAMYDNIDTKHALESIRKWLDLHEYEVHQLQLNRDFILQGIELVMTNNVFEFDNLCFLQRNGTAMGASLSVAYATIYFSYHKETHLCKADTDYGLLFYRRYIDDGIGIQLEHQGSHTRLLDAFNSFGAHVNRLEWTSSGLSRSITFLDLKLTIHNKSIQRRTYKKPLNLHLYIPFVSAHAPSVLKSLVHGQLLRFWQQNSRQEDYVTILSNGRI
jgi:hypothetical protein